MSETMAEKIDNICKNQAKEAVKEIENKVAGDAHALIRNISDEYGLCDPILKKIYTAFDESRAVLEEAFFEEKQQSFLRKFKELLKFVEDPRLLRTKDD